MKKLITLLLVGCMVAALSVSAFAFNIDSPQVTVKASQGAVSELDHSIIPAIDWTSTNAILDFVTATGLTGKIADPEELVYSWAFGYAPSEPVKSGDTVTFYDANIRAGKRVVLLQYVNDAWMVVLDTTAEYEGEVSFTYESAFPYAILVEGNGSQSDAAQTNGTQSSGTQSGGVKSDKTGDVSYELFLLGGMMLFGAVAVAAYKRREN